MYMHLYMKTSIYVCVYVYVYAYWYSFVLMVFVLCCRLKFQSGQRQGRWYGKQAPVHASGKYSSRDVKAAVRRCETGRMHVRCVFTE